MSLVSMVTFIYRCFFWLVFSFIHARTFICQLAIHVERRRRQRRRIRDDDDDVDYLDAMLRSGGELSDSTIADFIFGLMVRFFFCFFFNQSTAEQNSVLWIFFLN